MTHVTLETVKVPVELVEDEGAITADNYRVNLKTEFSLRVSHKLEAVLTAARALGERAASPEEIRKHVSGTLISVLRAVCTRRKLPELAKDREGFVQALMKDLEEDLGRDGLELDTVNVVHLDLTEGRIEEVLRGLEQGGNPDPVS
jgi:uncharacterized membrane protein YqiK